MNATATTSDLPDYRPMPASAFAGTPDHKLAEIAAGTCRSYFPRSLRDEAAMELDRRAQLAADAKAAIHDPALDALVDALTGSAPAGV